MLGHRSIKNTLIYTHLVNFQDEEFICKVAGTLDDARTLVESGFDYVTEMDWNEIVQKTEMRELQNAPFEQVQT